MLVSVQPLKHFTHAVYNIEYNKLHDIVNKLLKLKKIIHEVSDLVKFSDKSNC